MSRLSGDAFRVCAAAAARASAVSLVGVIIAIHLATAGLSPAAIGVVLGVGIAGSALGTVTTGLFADRWGRRRTLVAISLTAGLGYVGAAFIHSLLPLAVVSFVTMLNGMGRDRGPASALEQAILPGTVADDRRTWTMAWYNVAVDTGHAVGALGAVLPTVFSRTLGTGQALAHELTFVLCGVAVVGAALPYLQLGDEIERRPPESGEPAAIDPGTRAIVRRLALLFGMDSVGGGFLNSALIAYWFFERYGTTEAQLAGLFFAARVLNVISHLAAAWLARRIGLLNTMVFTHLPSSVFLMLAPGAPTAGVAALLFLAREALVEMDVPTRQSYVMAVVPPSARTYASGWTNVVRNAGWAVGPLLGGTVMQQLALAGPIFIGGTLKIAYDVALYRSFRRVRPPEERVT